MLPAEVVAGEVGLRVGDPVGARLRVEDLARERVAVDPGLRRQADEVEHRRHHVDAGGLQRAASGDAPGGPDHERDVGGGVVDEVGVTRLAVVAQALAVVGGEDDERALEQPLLAKPRREPPDHLVGVGDLGQVRLARIARGEGLGRVVGRVRVVEVDPGEEAPLADRLEPGERVVHDLVAGLLDRAERDHLVLGEVEIVGVLVEALGEAPLRLEHPGGHEGSRGKARLVQPLGERHLLLVQEEAAVVAHAVVGRHEASEDRRVRREGERDRGGRVSKTMPSRASASMFGVSTPRKP